MLMVKVLRAFKCLLCRCRDEVPCYICLFGLVVTVQPNYGGRKGQWLGQQGGPAGGPAGEGRGRASLDFNYSSLRLLQHFIFISLGDYFLNLFDICLTKKPPAFSAGTSIFQSNFHKYHVHRVFIKCVCCFLCVCFSIRNCCASLCG